MLLAIFDLSTWWTEDTARSLIIEIIGSIIMLIGAGIVGYLLALHITRKQRQALKDGDMTDLVLIRANYFDERDKSKPIVLKPRTSQKLYPILEIFPNVELARLVAEAAKKCDPRDCERASIVLDDPMHQENMRKRVVDACSEITGAEHLLRAFDDTLLLGFEGYATLTVAMDGNIRIIRIDIIDREKLRKFFDPKYRRSLRALEEEQSHDDMAKVFESVVPEVLDPLDPDVRRESRRAFRVSLQFRK